MSIFFDSPARPPGRDTERDRAVRLYSLIVSASDNAKALTAARAEVTRLQRQLACRDGLVRGWITDQETIVALRRQIERLSRPPSENWQATVRRLLADPDDADVLSYAEFRFLQSLERLGRIDERQGRLLMSIAKRFDAAP